MPCTEVNVYDGARHRLVRGIRTGLTQLGCSLGPSLGPHIGAGNQGGVAEEPGQG
jgi:hypothetical protein